MQPHLTSRDAGRKKGLAGPRQELQKDDTRPGEDGAGQSGGGVGSLQRAGEEWGLYSVGKVAWGRGHLFGVMLWK